MLRTCHVKDLLRVYILISLSVTARGYLFFVAFEIRSVGLGRREVKKSMECDATVSLCQLPDRKRFANRLPIKKLRK